MNKDQLLETARKIKVVSDNTATEYEQKADTLINNMNEAMFKRSDIVELVGENNLEMMKDNHSNHVRFIISLLQNYNPEVFLDTVLWVFRAYRSHGFTSNYWSTQLNTWLVVCKNTLEAKSYSEVYEYYNWMLINIPSFVILSDEKLDASNSLH